MSLLCTGGGAFVWTALHDFNAAQAHGRPCDEAGVVCGLSRHASVLLDKLTCAATPATPTGVCAFPAVVPSPQGSGQARACSRCMQPGCEGRGATVATTIGNSQASPLATEHGPPTVCYFLQSRFISTQGDTWVSHMEGINIVLPLPAAGGDLSAVVSEVVERFLALRESPELAKMLGQLEAAAGE